MTIIIWITIKINIIKIVKHLKRARVVFFILFFFYKSYSINKFILFQENDVADTILKSRDGKSAKHCAPSGAMDFVFPHRLQSFHYHRYLCNYRYTYEYVHRYKISISISVLICHTHLCHLYVILLFFLPKIHIFYQIFSNENQTRRK